MKAIEVSNIEEVIEKENSIIAMYMSRSVGLIFTKERVNKLRDEGYEMAGILKPSYILSDIFYIYYNKSKKRKEKDNRIIDHQSDPQPSIELVPNFGSR